MADELDWSPSAPLPVIPDSTFIPIASPSSPCQVDGRKPVSNLTARWMQFNKDREHEIKTTERLRALSSRALAEEEARQRQAVEKRADAISQELLARQLARENLAVWTSLRSNPYGTEKRQNKEQTDAAEISDDAGEERLDDDASEEGLDDASEVNSDDASDESFEDDIEESIADTIGDSFGDTVESTTQDAIADAVEGAVEEAVEDAADNAVNDPIIEVMTIQGPDAAAPTAVEMVELGKLLAKYPSAGLARQDSPHHAWAKTRWEMWPLIDRIFYAIALGNSEKDE